MNDEKITKLVCSVTLFLFFSSLALPAINTKYNTMVDIEIGPTIYGIEACLLGWTTLFSKADYKSYAWIANITFGSAIIAFVLNKLKFSILLTIVSIFLGQTAFNLKKIWNDKEPPIRFVDSLGFGFYIWELSFIFLLSSCVFLIITRYINNKR